MDIRNEEAKRKCLIIHNGALGDVITAFYACLLLKKQFGAVHAITGAESGEAGKALGVFDKWFPIDNAAFSSLYTDTFHPLIVEMLLEYDEIVMFSRSSQLEEALKRIGNGKVHRFSSRPESGLRVRVGIYLIDEMVQAGLLPLDSHRVLSRLMNDGNTFQFKPRSRRIVIHPGSGSHRKNWPIARFLSVEKALISAGLEPLFILGPAEEKAEDILTKNHEFNRIILKTEDMISLLDVLSDSAGYIGNDSGVSHLAAFMGLCCVVIFGPSDPLRWKPLGPRVIALREANDCPPCFEIDYRNCDNPACLLDITPESVSLALLRLMSE